MLDTEIEEVQKRLSDLLKPFQAQLRKKASKGAEILSKKLAELF
jgi:hypothetical protein